MKAPNITKGLWSLSDDGYSVLGESDEYGNSKVADVVGFLADAKMLAAAPMLAEALVEVCRVLESSPVIVDTVWVSSGLPETLLDHCHAALIQAGYVIEE